MRDIIDLMENSGGFQEFKAPQDTSNAGMKSVFLAGSIDMGKAENWQERLTRELSDLPVSVFNPRRDDWDSSWVQDISDPKFNEQVTWEMDHLDKASVIALYFDPKGQAPITLMELGLHAHVGNVVVCCPEGFWRRGNVQMVCARYDIPLYENIEDLIEDVRERLT